MIEFIQEGGTFMYIILAVSVVAVAIMIEKFYLLYFFYKPKQTFFDDIVSYVRKGDLPAAKLLCSGTNHPLAKVVAVMLNKNYSKEALESEIGKEIQKLTPRIQKHTNYLHMIGNIATLLGLIGTIQGLIMSFSSLQGSSSASKAELLATGISTAMNTTAFGLIIAIPCIVAYTIITTNETNIMQKYNETLTEIMHIMEFDLFKQ